MARGNDVVKGCKMSPHRPKALSEGSVFGLPYARGKGFRSLDEYLSHLRANSAIDLPWWREIKPGIYEYVSSATSGEKRIATRSQLASCFGFAINGNS